MKWALILTFSAVILTFVAAGALFVYYAKDAPKLDMSKLESPPSTVVYDKEGKVLATLGAEQRDLVQTDNIPVMLVNAVTSIEDHRFFNTRGVDPIRIAGSLLNNLRGGHTQGGSTLDMQLIKLSFYSTDSSDQTMEVKIQEAWLALQLDQKWSKEQIFTAYVNKVNMANGYYGMGTAAQAYYNKPLTQLSIPQLALLAGMPQAPNTYNPYKNPEAAKYRRDLVINSMYRFGKITEKQRDEAINTPIDDGLQELKGSVNIPEYANDFISEAMKQANQETGTDAANAGLKIYTTLDSTAQQNLYNIVNTNDSVPFTDDELQVASTLIDTQTGGVAAQIGSRKQEVAPFGFNQATANDRDWGSTMKPLVDYAPAFDDGIYKSTAQTIADSGPYFYPDAQNIQLNNWDNQYLGNITVRQALALSRNIPAIKTLDAVGLDKATAFANKLGLKYAVQTGTDAEGNGTFEPGTMTYSNGISSNTGSSDRQYGATSERMAAAYAAFSNDGIYTKPYYVSKIVMPDGSTKNYEPERVRAMKSSTAYIITDILKGVVKGNDGTIPALSTGLYAQTPGLPEAGKTGTSNYSDTEYQQALETAGITQAQLQGGSMSPDENFVGYTPQYSMAVWTGYKNKLQPIYGDNMYIAAKVFKAMMTSLYPDPASVADWQMPADVVKEGSELTVTGS
ncbi:transglycosylase domain-containing protein [Lactococcus garvieae]|uniref:Multimodular transpeptidase-transglycosylase / Penicillin-binding protein 1A/1B n=1 Tax=Lactococcus garvieae DCC43 TaxID=1231377 RepID=K2QCW4_9LACT|nr:transglycosylase domain-containing protein [Lactococcus garvieae]EKF51312.1 Multimodular transpeptidase-transglycosylase / Penicillin-binding protein 1A/1B [Lactococcus garvieae DCC43]